MAVAYVKSHTLFTEKTLDTSADVTVATTIPAGNLIVAAILFDNAGTASKPVVSSIAKMAGESASWVLLGAARSTSTSIGAFASGELWAIETTVAWSAANYAVTLDTSVTMKATQLLEFSGAEATARSTAGTAYSTTTTAASAASTGTAPVVGDLALGFLFGSNVAAAQAGDTDSTGGSWSTVKSVGSTGGSAATNNFGVVQYKVVTSTSAQTYNNSATMTAGNGSIVAVLRGIPEPAITQAAYRIYADGTETGSTALAAQDTGYSASMSGGDVNLAVRVRLQETAGSSLLGATDDWALQYDKNASGTWSSVVPPASFEGYPDSNEDNTLSLGDVTFGYTGHYVSVHGGGASVSRFGAKLLKLGTPTGTLEARVYAHTGTFGSTGTPTGSVLATSTTTVAATSLTTSSAWVYFDFDETFVLASGTDYFVGVELVGHTPSGTDRLGVGTDNSSPTYAGNTAAHATSPVWAPLGRDMIFELYPGPYLVDSYPDTNRTGTLAMRSGITESAQSFLGDGTNLASARFHLINTGTPNGVVSAALYAHSGTFGVGGSSVPTGSALAVSTTSIASTSLTTTPTWYTFAFDETFTLTNGTPYYIALTTTNTGGVGDEVNYSIDATPSHAGSRALYSSGAWTGNSTTDMMFEVWGVVPASGAVVPFDSSSLTDGGATTNRLGAGSGSFVSGKISETGVVTDLGWTASNYTELLYPVTLKQADLANGDVLTFRVLRNGAATGLTYTQTPTITATSAATQSASATLAPSASLASAAVAVHQGLAASAVTAARTAVAVAVHEAAATLAVTSTASAVGNVTTVVTHSAAATLAVTASQAAAAAAVHPVVGALAVTESASAAVAHIAQGVGSLAVAETATAAAGHTAEAVGGLTVTEAGTAAATQTGAQSAAGALAVTAALTSAGAAVHDAAAALAVSAAPSSSAAAVHPAVGALAVTAAQTASATETQAAGATLATSATSTSSATETQAAGATLAITATQQTAAFRSLVAGGSLSATATSTAAAAAVHAIVGSLSVTAGRSSVAARAVDIAGTLTATVTSTGATTQVTSTGATLTVTESSSSAAEGVHADQEAAGALSVTAALSAAAQAVHPAAGSRSATASLAAAATRTVPATGALPVAAAATATAGAVHQASASLAVTAAPTAAATKTGQQDGVGTLPVSAGLNSVARATRPAAASLTGTAALSSAAERGRNANAASVVSAALVAAVTVTRAAQAELDVTAQVVAAATRIVTAASALNVTAVLEGSVTSIRPDVDSDLDVPVNGHGIRVPVESRGATMVLDRREVTTSVGTREV